ncbi:MAG: hypothetical protein ACQET1_05545 [Gemmatimonadota bacterium]
MQALFSLAVPLFLSIPAGCDPVPDYLKEDIQAQRMAETGLDDPDPSGTSSSAGLSALRPIRVEAIDPTKVGSDTLSLGFHRLVHRCGTCHATPSPEMRSATEWKYVFSRMEKHIKDTGLIPLSDEDQKLILAFLQRNAGS